MNLMFAKKTVRVKQLKQVMEQTLFHYEVTGAKVKSEEGPPRIWPRA